MHKIPVKAGFPGLVFTIGMLTVFLMGIPALTYFLGFATVMGIGVAVMLRFIHRQGSVGAIGKGAGKRLFITRKKMMAEKLTILIGVTLASVTASCVATVAVAQRFFHRWTCRNSARE